MTQQEFNRIKESGLLSPVAKYHLDEESGILSFDNGVEVSIKCLNQVELSQLKMLNRDGMAGMLLFLVHMQERQSAKVLQ